MEPKLYDGNVIKNTSAIVIPDFEDTLMLAEESRLKMLLKQQDPMALEKKVNTTPVDYAALNQLSQDFEKRFVPQTELSAEQAFWSQNSMNSLDPSTSCRPTKVEVPKELFKVSMEKVLVITTLKNELRKLKGKYLADNVVTKNTIAPEMLKIDVEPIASKLLNNRTAHYYYLRNTQEQAAILRKHKHKIASSSNLVSNKPMLSCTGIKPSTSASGSQPSGNTKKDKIQQTPSSTQKNKVEAHSRNVKSSLKNKNRVMEPNETENVQHSKLNANSKLLCVKCNGCMLSDNHDLCVLHFINDVNARAKSKSVKKSSKRKV
ncbi:hypothetical protein Tco_1446284 [Tanacetum coccineum]